MFIPDPDLDFCYPSWISDQGVKKAPVPGFGSTTLALSMKKPPLFKRKKKEKQAKTYLNMHPGRE
jgi:hypothetical protein